MENGNGGMTRSQFEDFIRPRVSSSGFRKIMLAYRLAKYGHRNQKRDGGERYFEHPRAVALILMSELRIFDPEIIITALLHDLKEDAFILEWDDLETIFGKRVELMVRAVTKEKGKDYFSLLLQADTGALLVKCADRLHNLRTLGPCSVQKKEKQLKETREKFQMILKELESRIYFIPCALESGQTIVQILEAKIKGECDRLEKELQAQGV